MKQRNSIKKKYKNWLFITIGIILLVIIIFHFQDMMQGFKDGFSAAGG